MIKLLALLAAAVIAVALSGCSIGDIFGDYGGKTEVIEYVYSYYDIPKGDTEGESPYSYCYATLDNTERKWYKQFLNAAEEMKKGFINIGNCGSYTEKDINRVYTAVLYDHPDIFWMPYTYVIIYNGSKGDTKIAFDYENNKYSARYAVEKSERDSMREQLRNRVDELVAEAEKYGSEYEKEKFFNDAVCAGTEYAETELSHTAYGALIEGKAQCEGYSRALQILCNNAGIECELVCGFSDGEDHMWNYVKTDGEWSFTDVTWNDTALENPSYVYFNIDITRLYYDHTLAADNFSHHDCLSGSNMYYTKEGADLNGRFDECAELIKQRDSQGLKYAELLCEYSTDDEVSSRLARLQLHLDGIELDRYVYYRDVAVVYWE